LDSKIGKNESIYTLDPACLKSALERKTQDFQTRSSYHSDNHHPICKATGDRAITKRKEREPFQKTPRVIYIKERYFTMLKKDLIMRNPLRMMGYENDEIIEAGEFGAVLARAGVGKTAFLVQLSLNALLRGKNVLHISLEDPVNKVSLWYEEVFNLIAEQYKVDQISQLWESLLPHRFIMTFRVEGFSVPKLKERLSDLMEQNIFSPQMMIVDGFPFDKSVHQSLVEFKKLIKNYQMPAWFTIRTHRHEDPGPDGIPMQLSQLSDLFEIAIQLLPVGKEIHVKTLKGGESFSDHLDLQLDPSTMLLNKKL
jgi:hypothetical protein